MNVAVGLRVMSEMMEAEVTDQAHPKHAKLPERTAVRHTAAAGSVVLGGRRVPVSRPRIANRYLGVFRLARIGTELLHRRSTPRPTRPLALTPGHTVLAR